MLSGHLAPTQQPERIVLGLGSNSGDRRRFLQHGLCALIMHPEIAVQRISRMWHTMHVGADRQDSYYNLVCLAETRLAPAALLAVCKSIEHRLGRPYGTHGLPRTLDIDILLFGDRCGVDDLLTLPHPRLHERGFVLGPLAELAPALTLPDSGQTVAQAWDRIRAKDGPWLYPLADTLFDGQAMAGGEREWCAALAVHCR
jgi:2-amino-4-hydroxy-6-hydroxymethyldihydropteridine diphosphokinase